jgi:hypothetical protein
MSYRTARNWSSGVLIFWFILVILTAWGWVLNIIDLVGMTEPLTSGEGILRIIGIFIPFLGALLGFFF